MDTNLPESLKDIYRSLPAKIRETIFAVETTDAYDRAQEAYSLTPKQREVLSVQCGLLMMGLRLPQELVPVLMEELKLPKEKVSLIAQDINREVFNPIKNELKEIHAIADGATEVVEQKAVATAAAPIQTPKTRPAAPLPSFSVAQASSPRTSTPLAEAVSQGSDATTSKVQKFYDVAPQAGEVRTESAGPVSAGAVVAPSQSIFEQKMGGTFRMKSDTTSHVGGAATQNAASSTPPSPPKPDPYRETAV